MLSEGDSESFASEFGGTYLHDFYQRARDAARIGSLRKALGRHGYEGSSYLNTRREIVVSDRDGHTVSQLRM